MSHHLLTAQLGAQLFGAVLGHGVACIPAPVLGVHNAILAFTEMCAVT